MFTSRPVKGRPSTPPAPTTGTPEARESARTAASNTPPAPTDETPRPPGRSQSSRRGSTDVRAQPLGPRRKSPSSPAQGIRTPAPANRPGMAMLCGFEVPTDALQLARMGSVSGGDVTPAVYRQFFGHRPEVDALVALNALEEKGLARDGRLTAAAHEAASESLPKPLRHAMRDLAALYGNENAGSSSSSEVANEEVSWEYDAPHPKLIGLSHRAHEVTWLASASGGRIDPDLLGRILPGLTAGDVTNAIDELTAAGLLSDAFQLRPEAVAWAQEEMHPALASLVADVEAFHRQADDPTARGRSVHLGDPPPPDLAHRGASAPPSMDPGLPRGVYHPKEPFHFRRIRNDEGVDLCSYTENAAGFNRRLRKAGLHGTELSWKDQGKRDNINSILLKLRTPGPVVLHRGIPSSSTSYMSEYVNALKPKEVFDRPEAVYKEGEPYEDFAFQSLTPLTPMATNIARGGDRPGTWITLRTAKAGDSHDYTKSYEDQEEHEHDLRTRERVMTRLMFFSEGLHRVIQTDPVTRSEYGDSDDGMPIDNPFDARPTERSVHSSPGLRPRADLAPEDRFAHSFADTALAIRSMTGPELQIKIAETLADRWLADESFRESPATFLQEAGVLDPTGRIAKILGAEATDDQLRAAMRGLADLFPLDADPAAPGMAANIRGRYKAVLNNPSLLGRDPGWELMQCWMAG